MSIYLHDDDNNNNNNNNNKNNKGSVTCRDKFSRWQVCNCSVAFGIYPPDRSQRVRIEDVTSDVIVISKGVPQGSVLGPSLLSNNTDDNQIFLVITILRW